MKIKIICLIFIMSVNVACNKKNAPAPIDPLPPNNAGGPTGSYGTMQATMMQYYDGNNSIGKDSSLVAFFYATPVTNGIPTFVNAGTVSFNGVIFSNIANKYSDTTHTTSIHALNSTWAVSGSSNVSVISHTLNPSFVSYNGNAQLPDSISISAGINMSFSGLSNAAGSSILVEIISGSTMAIKSLERNEISCSFSSADLASLPLTSNAQIIILFNKTELQSFGGKTYSFINTLEHIKLNVKIVP